MKKKQWAKVRMVIEALVSVSCLVINAVLDPFDKPGPENVAVWLALLLGTLIPYLVLIVEIDSLIRAGNIQRDLNYIEEHYKPALRRVCKDYAYWDGESSHNQPKQQLEIFLLVARSFCYWNGRIPEPVRNALEKARIDVVRWTGVNVEVRIYAEYAEIIGTHKDKKLLHGRINRI